MSEAVWFVAGLVYGAVGVYAGSLCATARKDAREQEAARAPRVPRVPRVIRVLVVERHRDAGRQLFDELSEDFESAHHAESRGARHQQGG